MNKGTTRAAAERTCTGVRGAVATPAASLEGDPILYLMFLRGYLTVDSQGPKPNFEETAAAKRTRAEAERKDHAKQEVASSPVETAAPLQGAKKGERMNEQAPTTNAAEEESRKKRKIQEKDHRNDEDEEEEEEQEEEEGQQEKERKEAEALDAHLPDEITMYSWRNDGCDDCILQEQCFPAAKADEAVLLWESFKARTAEKNKNKSYEEREQPTAEEGKVFDDACFCAYVEVRHREEDGGLDDEDSDAGEEEEHSGHPLEQQVAQWPPETWAKLTLATKEPSSGPKLRASCFECEPGRGSVFYDTKYKWRWLTAVEPVPSEYGERLSDFFDENT